MVWVKYFLKVKIFKVRMFILYRFIFVFYVFIKNSILGFFIIIIFVMLTEDMNVVRVVRFWEVVEGYKCFFISVNLLIVVNFGKRVLICE